MSYRGISEAICWKSWKIQGNGKAELKAVLAELLHNEREWEAKEESTASEPRESSAAFWAETEALQAKFKNQCYKVYSWSESELYL